MYNQYELKREINTYDKIVVYIVQIVPISLFHKVYRRHISLALLTRPQILPP